jgi:hypothetical protein
MAGVFLCLGGRLTVGTMTEIPPFVHVAVSAWNGGLGTLPASIYQ